MEGDDDQGSGGLRTCLQKMGYTDVLQRHYGLGSQGVSACRASCPTPAVNSSAPEAASSASSSMAPLTAVEPGTDDVIRKLQELQTIIQGTTFLPNNVI